MRLSYNVHTPTSQATGPLYTIACLLHNMLKTNFLVELSLKVSSSLIAVYNTQEPSFSGQCEFVRFSEQWRD